MAVKCLNKSKINQFLEEYRDDIFNDILKKLQKEYNDDQYPIKSTKDKLHCIVCGGSYTRSAKCIHDKTKKHQFKLNEIRDILTELI